MKQAIQFFLIGLLANLLISTFSFAQAPQSFPYQAVARNAGGTLISNQLISIRISVLDLNSSGTLLYRETHSVTTNGLGLFNINIGQGTVGVGTFANINWANGAKYLKVEMDANGGSTYVVMGTSQLLSVPYAIYANTGGNLPNGTAANTTLRWNAGNSSWVADGTVYNNGTNVGIGTTSPSAKLEVAGQVKITGGVPGAGKVLTSDAAGLATWANASTDHDWYETGTTTPPNNVNDEMYHIGNTAIGKNTVGDASLDIDNTTNTSTLELNNTYSPAPVGVRYGIKNTVNSNQSKFGIHTTLQGVGSSIDVALGNRIESNGTANLFGVYNTFASTSSTGNYIAGMRNWFQTGSSYTGYITGVVNDMYNNNNGEHIAVDNDFAGTGTGLKYGIRNTFSGTGPSTFYGNHTLISTSGNGTHYGTYSSLIGTGTGNKYGVYSSISSDAGGIHYGIYSDALKSTGYAGYFLGRVALGTNTGNTYILPSSRGSNQQIMQTDGSGNVSWVNIPVTTPPSDISGSVNTIVKFTGTGTGGNSQIFDDGTNVGIGTLFPSAKLNVAGQLRMTGGAPGTGKIMTSDANGLATWTSQHDWHTVGTTTVPTDIDDNMYHNGNVSIGKTTFDFSSLDVANNSNLNTLELNNTFNSSAATTRYGLKNTVNCNQDKVGMSNTIQGSGGTIDIAVSNRMESNSSANQFGIYNVFASGASTGSLIMGVRNWFQAGGSYTGNLTGVVNDFDNNNNGTQTAVSNDFTGIGTGTRYAMRNLFTGIGPASFYGTHTNVTNSGNGTHYGLYDTLSGSGSGNKYGVYSAILSTAGGTHYGMYANVLKSTGYAGYFLGRVSIGTTASNNYILPSSRGTNAQIMQTDAAGNVSWVNIPSAGTSTLDSAYDFGGKGQGRIINADSGAVKIQGQDGFQVIGTAGTGDDLDLSGGGTRMFFNPKRAAFRAGFVSTTNWNKDSVGSFSFAGGYNTKAKGQAAIAFGSSSAAFGDNSTAMGFNTVASGYNAAAIGYSTTANGFASLVVGQFNDTIVSPETSIQTTTPLFIVGNGTDDLNRSNAMVVRNDGNVGVNANVPKSKLYVNGAIALKLSKENGTAPVTLDNTASVWYFTAAASSIVLPPANTCANRMYTIVNATASAKNISAFLNFSGASITTVAATSSIDLISDGTDWLKIR